MIFGPYLNSIPTLLIFIFIQDSFKRLLEFLRDMEVEIEKCFFFPGLRRHSVEVFMVRYKKKTQREANGNNLAVNPTGCHVIFLVPSQTSETCSPLGVLMAAEGLGSNSQIYFISNIPQFKND